MQDVRTMGQGIMELIGEGIKAPKMEKENIKTIKELEAEYRSDALKWNKTDIIEAKIEALKEVLEVIDELMLKYGSTALEELKARINGK